MASEALDILDQIRRATLANAAQLPLKEDVGEQWQGLGYLIGGMRVVSKLGEVSELLAIPSITRLPSVKSWVLGVANVRGCLVPIIDLHDFLQIPTTQPPSQWRVLVLESDEMVAGLVVEQSLGIQHFLEESFTSEAQDDLGPLAPYVCGAFRHGGRVYHEVRLKAILEDPRFLEVALTN